MFLDKYLGIFGEMPGQAFLSGSQHWHGINFIQLRTPVLNRFSPPPFFDKTLLFITSLRYVFSCRHQQ
jgi:hypothetical protein